MKLYGNTDGFEIASDYIDALVLTGTTAETFTVPTGAGRVRLKGNAAFYYLFAKSGSTPTAVAPAGDVTDGTASAYCPASPDDLVMLQCGAGDKISVVMAAGGIVTAEYWGG
jgi:hypothetical protein